MLLLASLAVVVILVVALSDGGAPARHELRFLLLICVAAGIAAIAGALVMRGLRADPGNRDGATQQEAAQLRKNLRLTCCGSGSGSMPRRPTSSSAVLMLCSPTGALSTSF